MNDNYINDLWQEALSSSDTDRLAQIAKELERYSQWDKSAFVWRKIARLEQWERAA